MWDWISKLMELNKQNVPFAFLTVTQSGGSTPREAGARMIVLSNGENFGTIGGGTVEKMAIDKAQEYIQQGITKLFTCQLGPKAAQCCGGVMEILIESFNTGPALYVFGAGHVASAICQVLEETPFRVHLIDERQEILAKINSPFVSKLSDKWENTLDTIEWSDKNCYVAIMTHDHALDLAILSQMINKPLLYLGLIGSNNKWNTFKNKLKVEGLTEDDFANVKCPIGLAKSGKAPKEIAINFAAEILSIHYNRDNYE
ncbi:MAG: xanthine dehydrogenase accessory protein XdhC [Bacteriovoracaceae bacterium]|nr:xanthine dehydrogenase accessory protein XdhC [Bacteriovoracaceae bacterium]